MQTKEDGKCVEIIRKLQLITDKRTPVTHLLKRTFSTGIVPQKGLGSREYIGACKWKGAL